MISVRLKHGGAALAALLLTLLATTACKNQGPKRKKGKKGQKALQAPGGKVSWLEPVDAKRAVVVRSFRGKYLAFLEHVDEGVVWKKPAHPVVGSTMGAGLVTLRYHQPGIDHPKVEYGVVARKVTDGTEQWRFVAPKRLTSSMFEPTFSYRAGHQLFEKFNDKKGLPHVLAFDRRNGKLLWERTVGAKGQYPFVLHASAKQLVLVVGGNRWLVLRRSDGKTVLDRSLYASARAGYCVHGGRFLYLQSDGLHALALETGKDSLINAGFWGPKDKPGPRQLLACGSYKGHLIFALSVVAKFMAPKTYIIAGVTADGKIQWRFSLGSWSSDPDDSRAHPRTSPFTGTLQRFVPFVAKDTRTPHSKLRLMVVDLKERKVVARGAVRKNLLNWRGQPVPPNRVLFSRFDTNALWDGTTGRLVSALRCKGTAVGERPARHGVIWICGGRESQGRWSLRHATTFGRVPGRYNTLDVADAKAEMTKFFGLRR